VARNMHKIGDIESLETASYLCRAAKNRALNIYNSRKKESEQGGFLEDVEDIPFDETEFERVCASCGVDEIAKCINQLPNIYRDVVVLRYLDDMSVAEISNLLGRKQETVKKQLNRGRQILKNMLKKEEI
jgi:RNA polymerase sigma-70 factor (ECF subfamily)